MKFTKTSLRGVWLIDLELREDDRGFLARTYCETEFIDHGLNTHWPQCNLTLTKKRGMIRATEHARLDRPPNASRRACAVKGGSHRP